MTWRKTPHGEDCDVEVATVDRRGGLRAELVVRLSPQDFTYRVVEEATGAVLEADQAPRALSMDWQSNSDEAKRALRRRLERRDA